MVGKSMDLTSSVMLLSGACLIWIFSDRLVEGMKGAMVESFLAIGNFEAIPGMFVRLAERAYLGIMLLLAPVVGGLCAIGLVINIGQVGLMWTWEPLGPHFGK